MRAHARVRGLIAMGEENPSKPRMQAGLSVGRQKQARSPLLRLRRCERRRGKAGGEAVRLLPGARDRAARRLCCAARPARIVCACDCSVACGHTAGYETLLQSYPDCQRSVCVMASLTQQMKSGLVPGLWCPDLSQTAQPQARPGQPGLVLSSEHMVAVAGNGSQPRLLESSQHSTQVIDICVLVHLDVVVGLRLGRWRSVGELDARRQHCAARCCCRLRWRRR